MFCDCFDKNLSVKVSLPQAYLPKGEEILCIILFLSVSFYSRGCNSFYSRGCQREKVYSMAMLSANIDLPKEKRYSMAMLSAKLICQRLQHGYAECKCCFANCMFIMQRCGRKPQHPFEDSLLILYQPHCSQSYLFFGSMS